MKTNLYFDTFSTATGNFSVAVDEQGAVVATAFGDEKELRQRCKNPSLTHDAKRVDPARREITEFLSGKRKDFSVTLSPEGTEFQKRVWSALLKIPFGETTSYGELAAKLGKPKAARAVGRANATNPICLIVPCHRVVGKDGSLTGFAFGKEIKERLLALEAKGQK